jgi:mannose-1-phosphate guanylyltransferase
MPTSLAQTAPAGRQTWAIVLAAGEGTRLAELTRRGGTSTPKQYCSLDGGPTLLGEALARAARLAPKRRTLVIVAEEHRAFWTRELADHPAENIVVQPRNKGTAAGILLPLLTLLERDPTARVALFPSDHHVAREEVLEFSLLLALHALDDAGVGLTLLGIVPDAPETGYGWIVPGERAGLLRRIERFVEKPAAPLASELMARGAVWNSFLLAANGEALLALYEQRLPALLAAFLATFAAGPAGRWSRLARLYEGLAPNDFSRDVLQGNERELTLELVPACGWTDLGTPERVAACLAERAGRPRARVAAKHTAALDLAGVLASRSTMPVAVSA